MPAYPLPFWAHLTSSRAIAPPESAHLRKAQGSSTVTLRLAFGDFFWRSDSVQQAAAGQGCYPPSATAYHPIDDAPLHRSLGSHLAVVAADPIPTVPSKRLGSRLRTTVWIRYAHTATSSACALGEQHLQQSTTTLLRILAARSFVTRSPPASPRLSITARTCSFVPLPHVAPHFALVPTTPYHRFRGRYRHVQIPQPWSFRQNRRSFHSLIEPHSARPERGTSSTLGRTGPEQLSIALH